MIRETVAPLLALLLTVVVVAVTLTAVAMVIDSRDCAAKGGTYSVDHDIAVTSHCRY